MLINPDYQTARELLLAAVTAVETQQEDLSRCGGRILAQMLTALENVPAFDRSPYDGYAFRAVDTLGASREHPVVLRMQEEIPAGSVPAIAITAGTASKVLTGAPIPPGADAVVPFEHTAIRSGTVTLFSAFKSGQNIVFAGEDVAKGEVLARPGTIIDAGLAGTLAAQGVTCPWVYRIARVGVISTGSELVDPERTPGPGQIRNSNRHTLETALRTAGLEPVPLGTVGDSAEEIQALIEKGVAECDAVVSTGGVSVGDYDLTPSAMEAAGVTMLFRGVDMKPGMACACGVYQGKIVCGLSGNPASALSSFYVVVMPALKKLMGRADPVPESIKVLLGTDFLKKSRKTRFLRGKLVLRQGVVRMDLPRSQGNAILSSSIGCDAMAVIPAGSGPISAGTELEGFLL